MKPQIEDCFILFVTYPGLGTRSLIEHSSIMYYSRFDFSDNLLSFAKKSLKNVSKKMLILKLYFVFIIHFVTKK